jgi:hypothetical protein
MHIGQWPRGFKNTSRLAKIVFDPELHAELKERHPDLQLISHIHPFIQWVTDSRGRNCEQWHPVSAIRVQSNLFTEGLYFYAISKSALGHHILRREELIHRVVRAETRTVLSREDSESIIQCVLDNGDTLLSPLSTGEASEMVTIAQDACGEDHTQIEVEFINELELRRNAKLKQVESHYRGKIVATEKTIATISSRPIDSQRGLAGFEKTLINLKSNYETAKNRISNQDLQEITYKPIACGLILITPS